MQESISKFGGLNLSKLRVFRAFAESLTSLSNCGLRQVAAISFDDGCRNISIGYNGPAAGEEHSCLPKEGEEHGCACVHAEANLLIKAHYENVLVTLAPCSRCAGLLINSQKVKRVIFTQHCFDLQTVKLRTEGIERLLRAGIAVWYFSDAMYTPQELIMPQ